MLDIIKNSQVIGVYRHQNPDGDALGSQFGLVTWLKEEYPDKEVYAVGLENSDYDLFPKADLGHLDQVHCAIVCDTANTPRIDGNLEFATHILKIDHHPNNEVYGDMQYVDDQVGSCSEILTHLIKDVWESEVSQESAQYFLAGMMTDTLRFTTESTKPTTLKRAAYLMEQGANITKLNQGLFKRSLRQFELQRMLAPLITYEGKFAWAVYSHEFLKEHDIEVGEAKLFTSMMSGIPEFEIWAIFTQDEEGLYKGSVRSRNITINELISTYNGGGHRLACGVRDLTDKTLKTLVDALIEISQSH